MVTSDHFSGTRTGKCPGHQNIVAPVPGVCCGRQSQGEHNDGADHGSGGSRGRFSFLEEMPQGKVKGASWQGRVSRRRSPDFFSAQPHGFLDVVDFETACLARSDAPDHVLAQRGTLLAGTCAAVQSAAAGTPDAAQTWTGWTGFFCDSLSRSWWRPWRHAPVMSVSARADYW
jgi:hypothetical protein